ncbi:hypothetical protein ACIO7M_03145 [Streptomyces toxytricini]|uniref:Uncharacterized protein n=1 Tax=Streptomyces toxytricini TaxID=67369 RepID=A0ABW8EA64_STRT5
MSAYARQGGVALVTPPPGAAADARAGAGHTGAAGAHEDGF